MKYNLDFALCLPRFQFAKEFKTAFNAGRITEVAFPTIFLVDETEHTCYIKLQLLGFGFSIHIYEEK